MLLKRHSFVPLSLSATTHTLLCGSSYMPRVLIGASDMFYRTIELLTSDIDLTRVPAPRPVIFPKQRRKKKKAIFDPRILFGPVERPVFTIDESELPY